MATLPQHPSVLDRPYLTIVPMVVLSLGPLPWPILLYFSIAATTSWLPGYPLIVSQREQALHLSYSLLHPQCLEDGLLYNRH